MNFSAENISKEFNDRENKIRELIKNIDNNQKYTDCRTEILNFKQDFSFHENIKNTCESLFFLLDNETKIRYRKDEDFIYKQMQNISKNSDFKGEYERISELIKNFNCKYANYIWSKIPYSERNFMSERLMVSIETEISWKRDEIVQKIKKIEMKTYDEEIREIKVLIEEFKSKCDYDIFNRHNMDGEIRTIQNALSGIAILKFNYDSEERFKNEYQQFIEEIDSSQPEDYERLLQTFKSKFVGKELPKDDPDNKRGPLIDLSIAYSKIRSIKDKDFASTGMKQEIVKNISDLEKLHSELSDKRNIEYKSSSREIQDFEQELQEKILELQEQIYKLKTDHASRITNIKKEQKLKLDEIDKEVSSVYSLIKKKKDDIKIFDISMKLFLIGFDNYEECRKKMCDFLIELKNVKGDSKSGIIKINGFSNPLNNSDWVYIRKEYVRSFMENYPDIDKIREIIPTFGIKIKYYPNAYYEYNTIKVCDESDGGGGFGVIRSYSTKTVKRKVYV